MSCFTTSYPRIKGAPARMADARAYTDYRPRCESYPTKAAGVWGQHDARQRTINDTESIMQGIHQVLNTKMGSGKCSDTMVPELYKRVCTHDGCQTINGHFAGIGTGRIFSPSLAGQAADAQGLAYANTAPLPHSFPIIASQELNNCAAGDPEIFWQPLAPKDTSIARAYPYSGPRGTPGGDL